jgi:hypothetical protein
MTENEIKAKRLLAVMKEFTDRLDVLSHETRLLSEGMTEVRSGSFRLPPQLRPKGLAIRDRVSEIDLLNFERHVSQFIEHSGVTDVYRAELMLRLSDLKASLQSLRSLLAAIV